MGQCPADARLRRATASDDQAVRQRNESVSSSMLETPVEDPYLDRAKVLGRPYVPTDLVHVIDDAVFF